MKNRFILSIILVSLAINGCRKNSEIDSLDILKNELNSIANSLADAKFVSSPCNVNNNYDNWGEALLVGITKVINEMPKSGISANDLENKLRIFIPKEYLIVDTTGINFKKIDVVYKEFISLFIKRNIFEALQVSFKMEDYVSKTNYLKEVDKAYILKMVSILRYSTYFSFSRNSKAENGRFKDCWIGKLQAMEDSGIFEQLVCIFNWPICFGAMLADCAIEVLF